MQQAVLQFFSSVPSNGRGPLPVTDVYRY